MHEQSINLLMQGVRHNVSYTVKLEGKLGLPFFTEDQQYADDLLSATGQKDIAWYVCQVLFKAKT